MKAGIAPALVVSQVKNTAAWLWSDPRVARAAAALDATSEAERDRQSGAGAYLQLLLAAHFATVGTFVPTDVDARIRHHVWTTMSDEASLTAACEIVDEVASWDVRAVSARTIEVEGRTLSGHDGEWLSVRAGALGRAGAVGATALVEKLGDAIGAEVDREERILREVLAGGVPAERALAIVTTVAHNLGDLSRVVDAWPKAEALTPWRARWSRLGHPDAPQPRPTFIAAGVLNKALMARENHRFLAMRKPRGLRSSRTLLLPFGPWFDAWGEMVARSEVLEDRDRAEIVTALLELHAWDEEQLGCLRALAGIHRATRGGLELFVPDLPARLRKDALRGRVRAAIDISAEHFRARTERRYEAELERLRVPS